MRAAYHQLQPGHYRLARGVRMRGANLICDYPLRALRPGATALRLLAQCSEVRTGAELAALLNLPVKRVETLCQQLYWKGLLDAGPQLPPDIWPGVSIIIPSYNRARQLESCLASLLQIDYPLTCLEIIVVDDASSDDTSAMLERFVEECKTGDVSLRIARHTRRQGVAISRNSGAERACMEVLAFIDSDCIATPGWLKELLPIFHDKAIDAVGGMIRARERRSTLGKYEDARSSLFMGARPQQVRLEGPLTYLPAANLLVRRSAWQKLGGFAPMTYGEDVDFCRLLLLSGSSIRYEPRGVVLHDYRTDITGFLKTRISYASSEAILLQCYPTVRRVLLMPSEQATFAGLAIGGLWKSLSKFRRGDPLWSPAGGGLPAGYGPSPHPPGRPQRSKVPTMGSLFFTLVILLALFGAGKRLAAVRRQHIPINPFTILRATLRGHLAYVYHLCRQLTRYYTLPMLIVGIIFPPLLLLTAILCSIVIGVDYARLRPCMTFGRFALCSLLDDCAYEIGVALGCIKQRTWKPLLPVLKK